MFQALDEHVRECWGALAPGVPPPRRLHFLKLSFEDYPPPGTSLVILAFADDANRPVAAVKAARDPEGDAGIRAEAERLEMVQRLLPAELARVAPRLLRQGQVNGREFFLSTALGGEQELHHTWGARRARGCEARLESALRWALDATRGAPAEPIGLGEWLGIATPERALEALGCTDVERRALMPHLQRAWEIAWPAGFVHGDFFPGNLLFQRGGISGVVDWSFAVARAPVFVDVLTYELSFSVHALGASLALEREAVHALRPFERARQELAGQGAETGLGSPARLAVLLACALRGVGPWVAHASTSKLFGRLLRLEYAGASVRA